MRKKKLTSINSKFFLSMSGVAILFMVFLMLGTSYLIYNHFFKLETNAALHQLDYITSQFDYYLTSTKNYSKSLITDSTVQERMRKYQKYPDTFNASDQNSIRSQISRTIQSTDFIHSVTLYSVDKDLVVTTEVYPYHTTLDELPLSLTGTWVPRVKHPYTNKNTIIDTLSFIRPFYDYDTAALLGYIEISIPESVISQIYKDKTSTTNHIFVTDSDGTIRSSDGSLKLNTPYNNFSFVDETNIRKSGMNPKAIILYKYFPTLDWYVFNEINLFDFLMPMFSLFKITIIITIICIIACLFISHRISHSITSPIEHLIRHTAKIKMGNWSPVQEEYSDSEIGQLFQAFNSMIAAQEKLKNDLLESQQMKTKISLDLLQQQVNPHFLYNTLDNICSLAEIDEKETLIYIVMNLSTFYREGLSNGKFYITIKEELEITEAYLHIMQVRYINKFDFYIHCPPDLYHYPCLKLLLQPIVENSIYHGIKELEYVGLLEIMVIEESDCILIEVQDNGIGFTEEDYEQLWMADSDHFGIKNIHQRIQLYYGDEYGLDISNRAQGGCITTIRIGKEAKTNVIEPSDS